MTSRDPVVIACASDERYVMPLATMLRSLIDNFSQERPLEIHIFQSGIRRAQRELICEGWPDSCSACWIDAKGAEFTSLPLWGRMPVSTYFKLGMADLLPARAKKAIWLDCDMIVLDDIAPLWNAHLDNAPLAAVQDAVVPFVSSPCGIARYEELGIDRSAKYFNAGVMVVDVDVWRRDAVREKAVSYLKQHYRGVTFWDQEGLNAVLAGKWKSLDPRWNHNASDPRVTPPASAAIVHFAGGLKPWSYRTRNKLRSLYYDYLDKTSFAGWRPEPSLAGAAVALYEESGLRALVYPAENLGMRIVRNLSR